MKSKLRFLLLVLPFLGMNDSYGSYGTSYVPSSPPQDFIPLPPQYSRNQPNVPSQWQRSSKPSSEVEQKRKEDFHQRRQVVRYPQGVNFEGQEDRDEQPPREDRSSQDPRTQQNYGFPRGNSRRSFERQEDPGERTQEEMPMEESREDILQMLSEKVKAEEKADITTKLFKHAIYYARNACDVKIQDLESAIRQTRGQVQTGLKGVQGQVTNTRDDFTVIAWKKYKKALDILNEAAQFQEIRAAYEDVQLMVKNCMNQTSQAVYLSGVVLPSYTYPPEKKCYGATGKKSIDPTTFSNTPMQINTTPPTQNVENPNEKKKRFNFPWNKKKQPE